MRCCFGGVAKEQRRLDQLELDDLKIAAIALDELGSVYISDSDKNRIQKVSSDGRVLTVDVLRDGELHAAFESMAQARRWVQKMGVVAPIAA